ncbi:MAG TPA: M28 family metallopeptidase [Pyrinomonadaceae bacterium]|nr:M28 family metallopeptidase [Pyrinomonadaceae bacterium]
MNADSQTMINEPSLTEPLKNSSRFLALAFVLIVPLLLLGCPSSTNKPADGLAPPPASPAKSDFDGDRAFEQVRKQVEFGPRPAGSAELEKTRNYMIDQLKSSGLKVLTDEFHVTTPVGDRKMVNVTAELPGESTDVIIISSHYDTKYFKDMKFVGANDGGSSTGALMEIARVMAASKQKPKMTYWFVFFDGEEAFCFDWDECHNPNPVDPKTPLPDHTYGSRRYVAQLIQKNELSRVRAMILLDMIGYKNLRLGRADLGTTWLIDTVWQTAKQLGYGHVFVDALEGVGDDDHGPFLRAGIDAMDIIQLSTYGVNDSEYWHTKEDTLDKISAKSLKTVGDAVLGSLPKIEERLANKPK